MNFRELAESEEFSPLLVNEDAALTQAPFYGEWHKALGRKVRRFVVERDGQAILFAQIIKFPLPFGQSFLYIPYGPVVKGVVSNDIVEFAREFFLKVLKEEGSVFLRFDHSFPIGVKTERADASGYFQVRKEWVVDFAKSEDELLANMGKNHRYSIRTSQKKGVRVSFKEENITEEFEKFYALLSETSHRKGFGLVPREYYKATFESIEKEKNGFLVTTSSEGAILAYAVVVWFGKEARYLLGSSSTSFPEKLATYSLQWEVIKKLKTLGLFRYNLGGGAIDSGRLSHYKQGFGAKLFDHGQMRDLIGKKIWYLLYRGRKVISNIKRHEEIS